MCGIVGFINCGSEEELLAATKSISHRGPDNQSVKWFSNKGSGLGHTRLSIIDLANTANQPMYDEEVGNWIVFNGEIYNYKSIKKELELHGIRFNTNSDTEVILKAYRKWGIEMFQKLNGMFAFCIFNEHSNKVIIVRDRLGIKPLYYYKTNNGLAFSSEIKAILNLNEYKPSPDLYSLHTPVHYQLAPFSGFKDILKLGQGCYIEFNNSNEIIENHYWEIKVSENVVSEKEAIQTLDILLNDSIELNMIADTEVAIMLSGGLDSSLLAAMLTSKTAQPLNSFTIKFKKDDLKRQGNVDDSFFAKKLANILGLKHHEIIIQPDVVQLLPKLIYHLDEPIADPASINTYLISNAAREKGIKVLLTGMGADEVFAGYRSYSACLKADTYQKYLPDYLQKLIYKSIKHLPESNSKRNFKYIRWLKRFTEVASLDGFNRQYLSKNSALNSDDFSEYFKNSIDIKNSIFYKLQKSKYDSLNMSYLNKMCYLDTKYYMTDHNLTYCDKSMMAAGVEGRPPLIDHRIVEYMFTLNDKLKIKNGIQKYLLKKVAEKYIPKEIIYRPKAPFSAPMRGWLKNELKEMVNDILSFESVKKRGLYNPAFVQKLINDNSSGLKDNSQLIWRLMVNEIWFRTFF